MLTPRRLLLIAIGMAGGFLWLSLPLLPDPVATQFGMAGQAVSFMSRRTYGGFMSVLMLALPLIMILAFVSLPRGFPHLVNIPHRHYWLAPPRREQSLRDLAKLGFHLASLLTVWIGLMHALILHTHQSLPARLDNRLFFALLAMLLLSLAFWAGKLLRRFGKPPI